MEYKDLEEKLKTDIRFNLEGTKDPAKELNVLINGVQLVIYKEGMVEFNHLINKSVQGMHPLSKFKNITEIRDAASNFFLRHKI